MDRVLSNFPSSWHRCVSTSKKHYRPLGPLVGAMSDADETDAMERHIAIAYYRVPILASDLGLKNSQMAPWPPVPGRSVMNLTPITCHQNLADLGTKQCHSPRGTHALCKKEMSSQENMHKACLPGCISSGICKVPTKTHQHLRTQAHPHHS